MIDAKSAAAFVWLALSTLSFRYLTQPGGEFGPAVVVLLPACPHQPSIPLTQ
jgi:hypothetical protein